MRLKCHENRWGDSGDLCTMLSCLLSKTLFSCALIFKDFKNMLFFNVQMATKKFTDSQHVCCIGLSQDCF